MSLKNIPLVKWAEFLRALIALIAGLAGGTAANTLL